MPRLTSITDVTRHFDLPLSTLRFWERRGLLGSHREATRRCYDDDQLYRIALLHHWRDTGLLSIRQIEELAAAGADTQTWYAAVDSAIEVVNRQIARLEAAREYLEHLRRCPHRGRPDACPGFRDRITLPGPTDDVTERRRGSSRSSR